MALARSDDIVQLVAGPIVASSAIAALAPEPIDKAGGGHGGFAGVSQVNAG